MSKPLPGESAPDFSAEDTRGQMVRLQDYQGDKSVVLVFNRGFF